MKQISNSELVYRIKYKLYKNIKGDINLINLNVSNDPTWINTFFPLLLQNKDITSINGVSIDKIQTFSSLCDFYGYSN